RSWRIALLERFWQARHPPRYAAFLTPSSPRFRHSSRATGKWYVGIYGYKRLGNIYDLIPEDQQVYDEDGRIVPPKELNGRPVFDVKDEFVLTDELVERKEGVVFDVATLEIARDYIREHGWDKYDEFRTAWDRLNKLVS
ncbi:hypothetical protein, partial [Bradyrhizobium sp. Mp27]|uniref:hypothetical protein n=1 Tax=Bradyrhizobium sp. Mp27 TaxID=3042157 RepID=UPI00248BC6D5